MNQPPLIVLTGPTAVGKTKASLLLAKKIDGEIISADSMQVYRRMNIGSAKIMPEEMDGVPHHLIDVLEPWEDFNVVQFQKKVNEILPGIYDRGHIPILVGGTGFYIQSVVKQVDFTDTCENIAFRESMEHLAKEKGVMALHDELARVDLDSAKTIHPNNVKRVIRALEYYYETNEPISKHNAKEQNKPSFFRTAYFVLNCPREELYRRIDTRVDVMIEKGLVEEVRALQQEGLSKKNVSMQGLGYKEILSYLNQEMTLDEAIYQLKRDTRHFAKRQLTWFRREKEAIWISKEEYQYDDAQIVKKLLEQLEKKEIQ